MSNAVVPAAPRDSAAELIERHRSARSGRERPGRYWKIDLESIDLSSLPRGEGEIALAKAQRGVTAVDFAHARELDAEAFACAYGATGVGHDKFGALAAAYASPNLFIHVAAGADVAEPIELRCTAGAGAVFPYVVVFAERGARATIVARFEAAPGATVCAAIEVVTGEHADVTFACAQALPADARIFFTRDAAPGSDARVAWAVADLGAALAVGSADATIAREGAHVDITAIFFPRAAEHVDLVTTVAHDVGNARSETLIKSAASERGQARYLGNIRIAQDAQGSNASLRDDALLLSPTAHIDSVPALEIAANDVKAFHGATVGAIDDELIFYMESRGIERFDAERMIALGFFEPAIERFPTDALRDELRATLRAKVG